MVDWAFKTNYLSSYPYCKNEEWVERMCYNHGICIILWTTEIFETADIVDFGYCVYKSVYVIRSVHPSGLTIVFVF